LKNMCDLEMLHCAKRDRSMMVLHLPISLLTACSRCIVMTYLFENSIMAKFMQMKGVEVEKFSEVELLYTEEQIKERASERIEFIATSSTRKVKRMNMTSRWYTQVATKEQLKQIGNAIYSVARLAENKEDVMFTFPKELREPKKNTGKKIPIRAFISDKESTYWVYCGTKATNDLSHKRVLIHAFNRYPMVSVSAYLQDYGFPIDPDKYALSEMIQWVWRSAIRRPEGSIKIAILPPRMERIFKEWLYK